MAPRTAELARRGGSVRRSLSTALGRRLAGAAVGAALLAALAKLWRRWVWSRSLRRREAVEDAADSAAASAEAARPRPSAPRSRAPLARPGTDADGRLDRLEDDPRYFAGAQLGKAQRAAMGESLDAPGTNTVSFNPASTLVRPSMRIRHASLQTSHAGVAVEVVGSLRPDDVVAIPACSREERDMDLYLSCAERLGSAPADGVEACREVVWLLCGVFGLREGGLGVRVEWHRPCSGPPEVWHAPSTSEAGGDSGRITVYFTLGSACELSLCRSCPDGGSKVRLPSRNGTFYLFGCDVVRRLDCDVVLSEGASRGTVVVRVDGHSRLAVEEAALAPMPTAPAAALKDGGGVDADCGRPCMRILTLESAEQLGRMSHDDVIIIPDFFCHRDDWDMYYRLLKQVRDAEGEGAGCRWESWHEGSHLLTKKPDNSDAFRSVIDMICEAFAIANKDCRDGNSVGTRFNWYRDGADWKPFHHDSAAFNRQRAEKQNCTVGASFGAARELSFRHAKTGELIYFPQTNGMLFFFGRDVNIRWQHGINALPAEEQSGKGRVSIILWGLTTLAAQEEGSPAMLEDAMRSSGKGKGKGDGRRLDGRAEPSRDVPCRNWLRSGRCDFGNRCRFSHANSFVI